MAGIEEKLLISFRAKYRAIHQARLESKIRGRANFGLISITIRTAPWLPDC
jgi:hypothetical protein